MCNLPDVRKASKATGGSIGAQAETCAGWERFNEAPEKKIREDLESFPEQIPPWERISIVSPVPISGKMGCGEARRRMPTLIRVLGSASMHCRATTAPNLAHLFWECAFFTARNGEKHCRQRRKSPGTSRMDQAVGRRYFHTEMAQVGIVLE